MAAKDELLLTRVFKAPRHVVFEAWKNPEHLARWWGPRDFSLPKCEMDFRTGGRFRFTMRGPDGVEFPFDGTYVEVLEPVCLVFYGKIHDGNDVWTSVTFAEDPAGTRVTVHQRYSAASPATRGAPEGWGQSLDRLAKACPPVEGTGGEGRQLTAERVVDAPRELVFRAFTEAEHLARWWGPKGFANTFRGFDPTPGGKWTFVMHGPDGATYPNECVFLEVVPPERIVIQHLPWPRFQLTASFAERAGKTLVTWHQLFESTVDMNKVKGYAREGNEQNLERLAAQLDRMSATP